VIDHKPEAVRVTLLGGFSVSVGSRVLEENAWRLKNAAALVKLLALAPGHRLHREQVMEAVARIWQEGRLQQRPQGPSLRARGA
jgi:DNA-binding SARP family transcriptional activator